MKAVGYTKSYIKHKTMYWCAKVVARPGWPCSKLMHGLEARAMIP
jgi:hypothetical protein